MLNSPVGNRARFAGQLFTGMKQRIIEYRVEHLDPFRHGGPQAPEALIERTSDVDNEEIGETGCYAKSSARSKRPRNSLGESNYP